MNERSTYLTHSIVVSINNGHKTKPESYSNFVLALSLFFWQINHVSEVKFFELWNFDFQLKNLIIPRWWMILITSSGKRKSGPGLWTKIFLQINHVEYFQLISIFSVKICINKYYKNELIFVYFKIHFNLNFHLSNYFDPCYRPLQWYPDYQQTDKFWIYQMQNQLLRGLYLL